ncbi:MAG: amidohydrolase family protein [Vicinamibacteria bacterium]
MRISRTSLVTAALVFAVATSAFAVGGPLIITSARVVTVSGGVLENASIIIQNGRISSVGSGLTAPAGARIIDGRGKTVYPGLFDGLTYLGLAEVTQGAPGTVDTNETGDINPHARSWVALHPDSELLPVARAFGITTALSAPGTAQGGQSLIAGQSAVIRTVGDTPMALTLKAPIAMHMRYPSGAPVLDFSQGFPNIEPKTFEQRVSERKKNQEKDVARLKGLLEEARAYGEGQAAGTALKVDLPMEALALAAMGKIPVVMRANAEADIKGAIKFANESRIKLIIAGAAEAWRCTEDLKKNDVAVLIGVDNLPTREGDPYDAAYANAATLHKAGVRFAIVTDEASNSRNLPFEAAMAYAFGLPREAAIRSITLSPAEIFGVSTSLGSIEPGKAATLIITNADILDHRTSVTNVIIDGQETSLDNKHQRLYDRYKAR